MEVKESYNRHFGDNKENLNDSIESMLIFLDVSTVW